MNISEIGKKVLSIEAEAIKSSIPKIEKNFEKAVDMIASCTGRIVVTGMGKSGIIAKKIAATLTSTGTPALFLHPSEALHGDIGNILPDDLVVALSSSGKTMEIVNLIEFIKRTGVKLISLVGNVDSLMAEYSDLFLDCSIEKEACPIGLVPTASTTLTLAVGDALAVALMEKKGFSENDFLVNHPGGNIGKKLLKVKSLMHSGSELPLADDNMLMSDVIRIINDKKFGVSIVTDAEGVLCGVITDGDIRRLIVSDGDFLSKRAADILKGTPFVIDEESLATEALRILEENQITSLVVTDEKNRAVGLIHLHDLWRTEMI